MLEVEAWCREHLRAPSEELGERVRRGELWELARADASELSHELGLSLADAGSLAGAFRFARALASVQRTERPAVRSPRAVFELLEPELRGLDREAFHALALDGKHGLVRRYLVSVGTLTTSLVHPREVFRPALRFGAAALVVAHNHPSGDPEPSPEDEEVTRRLAQAGRLLGVPLLDHVVIGERRYVSLAERLGLGDGRYKERSQRT
ncbi:MAG: DNA repair protein RadC [Planctomycetes bacterium]|nr:DNA repair protein RadC [Planctomycetota bacterium]